MDPHLQDALVTLLGALVVSVPLTAPHVPKWIDGWAKARARATVAKAEGDALVAKAKAAAFRAEADAKRTTAETDKLEAETTAAAFTDLRARLDECEKKHDGADTKIQALERQGRLDAELLEKFSAKIEKDEGVIRGLRKEMQELRNIVQSGGST